jgi:hypothetical protein
MKMLAPGFYTLARYKFDAAERAALLRRRL